MRLAATIALGTSCCFTAVMALFCLFGAVVAPIAIALDPAAGTNDQPAWLAAIFYGVLFLIQAVSAGFQIRGTIALNKADSYGLAWAGVVAALLGGMMCCNGWNLAAGIFLIIALSNPTVRADFDKVARGEVLG